MNIAIDMWLRAVLVGILISAMSDGARSETSAIAEARLRLNDGDAAGAIRLLETYTRINNDSADAYDLLGFAHVSIGQLEAAAMSFDAALIVNPEHLSALRHQGILFLLIAQPKFAERNLEKLARLCRCNCREYKGLAERLRAYNRMN